MGEFIYRVVIEPLWHMFLTVLAYVFGFGLWAAASGLLMGFCYLLIPSQYLGFGLLPSLLLGLFWVVYVLRDDGVAFHKTREASRTLGPKRKGA